MGDTELYTGKYILIRRSIVKVKSGRGQGNVFFVAVIIQNIYSLMDCELGVVPCLWALFKVFLNFNLLNSFQTKKFDGRLREYIRMNDTVKSKKAVTPCVCFLLIIY